MANMAMAGGPGPADMGMAGPPDLGAVGNAASASKAATNGQQLQEFTVKRGEDGGITVCETTVNALPPGRRYGASFQQKGDYTETVFGAQETADAVSHLTDLMGQLGVNVGGPPPPPQGPPPPGPPPGPPPPMAPPGGGGY